MWIHRSVDHVFYLFLEGSTAWMNMSTIIYLLLTVQQEYAFIWLTTCLSVDNLSYAWLSLSSTAASKKRKRRNTAAVRLQQIQAYRRDLVEQPLFISLAWLLHLVISSSWTSFFSLESSPFLSFVSILIGEDSMGRRVHR